jgi:uncharacterized protein (DUF1697 family)
VNVGTKNSLPMATLRELLTRCNCTDVSTYVQSGNAVFSTKLGAAALTKAVEAALAAEMGRPIATTLRTGAELRAVIRANPFADVATNPSYQCVTFLSEPPTPARLAPLAALELADERWLLVGREIHSWHPRGQGRSALAAAIGKLRLDGAVTTRNWNTVLKLAEMVDARTARS